MAVEYVQAVCSFRIRRHYLFYYYIGDYILHFRQIVRSHFVHDCMKKKKKKKKKKKMKTHDQNMLRSNVISKN